MMVGKGDYQNTQLEFVTMQALLGSSHKRSHRQKTTEQTTRKKSQLKKEEEGAVEWKVWFGEGTETEKSELDKGWGSERSWQERYISPRARISNLWTERRWSNKLQREETLETKTLVIPTLSEKTQVNLFHSSLLSRFLQFLCCCHSIILWLLGPTQSLITRIM